MWYSIAPPIATRWRSAAALLLFFLLPGLSWAQYSFEQVIRNSEEEIAGISNPTHVLVSPDNRFVYVAGYDDDAIAIFSRNEDDGSLTFQETVKNGENGVSGLAGIRKFVFSEDGRFVYAVAVKDNALTTFSWADNGSLTFISSLRDEENEVDGLGGAWALAISPDGSNIYVAAYTDNAVSVFSVDSLSGQLTFESVVNDTGDLKLGNANSITVSPDNLHVYVTGQLDDGVSVFARDLDNNGQLTPVQNIDNWAAFFGFGSVYPTGIVASQDGKNVYVSGFGGSFAGNLTAFSRNASTGELTIQQRFADESTGDTRFNTIVGFGRVSSVTITPDGQTVYTTNYENSQLSEDYEMFTLQRDLETGRLSADLTIRNGSPAVEQPNALAFDSTGNYFYVVAGAEDALTVFSAFYPVIDSLSVLQGFSGDELIIWGEDFRAVQANGTVNLGETSVEVLSWSNTAITVRVPELSAGNQPVVVTVNGYSTPGTDFTVDEITVEINRFLPLKGKPGTLVEISGENFGDSRNTIKVVLGSTEAAEVRLISSDSLTAVVPKGLSDGEYTLRVVVDGSSSPSATKKFTIDTEPPIPAFSINHLADEVATDASIQATFNELLFPPNGLVPLNSGQDFASAVTLYRLLSAEEAVVESTTTYADQTLTTVATLEENTFYRLQLNASALADACGNLVQDTSILFTTGEYQPLIPTSLNGDLLPTDSSLMLQVNDVSLVRKATLYYRGICSWEPFRSTNLLANAGFDDQRSVTVRVNDVQDPIGIEYYYKLEDYFAADTITTVFHAYHTLETGEDVPLQFGDTRDEYNTLTFPLVLEKPTVTEVLSDELGGYDKEKWRLFIMNELGSFVEYPDFTTFRPGQGYLLIVRDNIGKPLNSGKGHRIMANKDQPYQIPVHPGWNLIGNPAPLTIDWKTVANDPANATAQLESFVLRHSPNWEKSAVELGKFEGGLVFVHGATEFITIPLSAILSTKREETLPDKRSWEVPLTLLQEESGLRRTIAGFGMHPKAQFSGDRYDRMTPPVLGSFLNITFHHSDYFYPYFTKDVVPLEERYVWDFAVEASENGLLQLGWDNQQPPAADKLLLLVDRQENKIINMRSQTSYSFLASEHRPFQIFYGSQAFIDEQLRPNKVHLLTGYPNPFSDEIKIPFTLPPADNDFQVKVSIYNLAGQRVQLLLDANHPTGFYKVSWDGQDKKGNRLPSGIYFVELQVQHDQSINIQRRRLILLPNE